VTSEIPFGSSKSRLVLISGRVALLIRCWAYFKARLTKEHDSPVEVRPINRERL
jgi:hypothetical protein